MSIRILWRWMCLVRMGVGLWRRSAHGGASDLCPEIFIEEGAGAGMGVLGERGDWGGTARLFAAELLLEGELVE